MLKVSKSLIGFNEDSTVSQTNVKDLSEEILEGYRRRTSEETTVKDDLSSVMPPEHR